MQISIRIAADLGLGLRAVRRQRGSGSTICTRRPPASQSFVSDSNTASLRLRSAGA